MAEVLYKHTPVFYKEVASLLPGNPDGIYVDGTLGGGGHAQMILSKLSEKGKLIGIDRDIDAIEACRRKLSNFHDRFVAVKADYKDFESVLDQCNVGFVDGILLDLGVSSHQLDVAERGFSYSNEAKLDMRMDRSQELTAYDVVNSYDEKQLAQLIRKYGEEKFAGKIASQIVRARAENPITTTTRLVEIIKNSIPAPARRTGGNPAKRTFQAIRIEVNSELTDLDKAIETMIKRLNPGGMLCVLTFHSLEDRIVKHVMRNMESPCICPSDAPVCTCGRKPFGKAVPRKAMIPSDEEISENPRAKSAKLRVFIRG